MCYQLNKTFIFTINVSMSAELASNKADSLEYAKQHCWFKHPFLSKPIWECNEIFTQDKQKVQWIFYGQYGHIFSPGALTMIYPVSLTWPFSRRSLLLPTLSQVLGETWVYKQLILLMDNQEILNSNQHISLVVWYRPLSNFSAATRLICREPLWCLHVLPVFPWVPSRNKSV